MASPTSAGRSTFRRLSLVALSAAVLVLSGSSLIVSCGGDDEAGPPGTSVFPDSGGATTSSGSNGISSGLVTPDEGGPPLPPDAGSVQCAEEQAQPISGKRPVDIIFVIDNSESMSEEIAQVEQQINVNFTNIIDATNADYHIVMLSAHGAHDGDAGLQQRICVSAPLSSTNCQPIPAEPAETDHFQQLDLFIDSNDAWCRILTSFRGPDDKGRHPAGWAGFLRPDAFKEFAVITDDRVFTSCLGYEFDDHSIDPQGGENAAGTFETALFALSPLHFGSASHPNFVWHSIIGLAPFDVSDLSKPHPPTAPIVADVCTPSAVSPATGYQALSRMTAGLRYPTCGLDFTTIFRAMAEDVIDKTTLACDYEVPTLSPDGGAIDPATTVVHYAKDATSINFTQVASADQCGTNNFYVDPGAADAGVDGGDAGAGARIKLCNDACALVRNNPGSTVNVTFGCFPPQTGNGQPH